MLILILGIILIAFVTLIVLKVKSKRQFTELYDSCLMILGVVSLGFVIAICCLTVEVATESIIDEKIAMYQEENEKIEQDINRIVREYMEHEQNTFSDLKTEESSITLVTLFPELKSDSLVQQQLEIYAANNAEIKNLREEKIEISKIKWILYFGR